ncbi:hypothetical protein PYW07_010825 [Mythimna separata]|uniref:C2H2-type domain-containing protein n=1 Tax=Mythimna separata TaxID=271217 RepID=A0AAD7Y8E3_MYTSE|nr:hypothetical protein PYW07_010825 [Mythimna separata]
MALINNALSSIINRKKDFCCLCLCTLEEEPIRLNDEVVVNINSFDYDTVISEVLSFIFDEEMYSYISTFNMLCDQCTKSAISGYRFKHTCQKNAEYVTDVLDKVTNNFEYATPELFDCTSLYVSLNPQDLTSKQFYDTKKNVNTPRAALRRFRTLDNTNKIKVEDIFLNKIKEEQKENDKSKNKKSRNTIDIPTNEMLIDKNNRELLRCRECYKEYPTIWNLRNHFIRVHAPKKFKCSECPRSYGSSSFLEAHKAESHCRLVCSECGKSFNNKHTLKMHELGHHLSLVCQDCGRVYKNKTTFRKHIELKVCGKETRANPAEATFTCDYCNKKYTQKVSLRVHIQHEHGNYKSHVCEWCGKKFWAQSRLKAHSVKHTRERNFPCSICGGKFVTRESLLYHTRTHTGEKPYKCPHCDCRFLSASRRTDHVKRHHLGATLECKICHSKFNTKTFLLKHQKTHTESENKTKLPYQDMKTNTRKQNYEDHSLTVSVSDTKPKNLWQISKVDEDTIPSFQKIIDSSEVDLEQFTEQVYEDESTRQSSEDGKVYLEVSDDADDYIKILGV